MILNFWKSNEFFFQKQKWLDIPFSYLFFTFVKIFK
jgi:hypothetical protein